MGDGTWLWPIRISLDYCLGKPTELVIEVQEEPILRLLEKAGKAWRSEPRGED